MGQSNAHFSTDDDDLSEEDLDDLGDDSDSDRAGFPDPQSDLDAGEGEDRAISGKLAEGGIISRKRIAFGKSSREGYVLAYAPSVKLDNLLKADKVIVRRSWRSLPLHWLALMFLAYLAIKLGNAFPQSIVVIAADVGVAILELEFPFFIIPVAIVLGHAYYLVYHKHLEMNADQIVYYRGHFPFRTEVAELEPARMQVVTVKQKPWEVVLGVGNVSVGTFTRRSLEFNMYGIANPQRFARILKIFVRRAREREQKGSDAVKEKALRELL